jgi:serine/threonine protein kinase
MDASADVTVVLVAGSDTNAADGTYAEIPGRISGKRVFEKRTADCVYEIVYAATKGLDVRTAVDSWWLGERKERPDGSVRYTSGTFSAPGGGEHPPATGWLDSAGNAGPTLAYGCGPLGWVRPGAWVGMRGFGAAQIVRYKKGRYRVRFPHVDASTGERAERSVAQHEIEPAAPPDILARCPEGAGALVLSGAPEIEPMPPLERNVDINGEYSIDAAEPVANGWPQWIRHGTGHSVRLRASQPAGRLQILVQEAFAPQEQIGYLELDAGCQQLPTGVRSQVHGCSTRASVTVTSLAVPSETRMQEQSVPRISQRMEALRAKRASANETVDCIANAIRALKALADNPQVQSMDKCTRKASKACAAVLSAKAELEASQQQIRTETLQARDLNTKGKTFLARVSSDLGPERDNLRRQYLEQTKAFHKALDRLGVFIFLEEVDESHKMLAAAVQRLQKELELDEPESEPEPEPEPQLATGGMDDVARKSREARLAQLKAGGKSLNFDALAAYSEWEKTNESSGQRLANATDDAAQAYAEALRSQLLEDGCSETVAMSTQELLKAIGEEERHSCSTPLDGPVKGIAQCGRDVLFQLTDFRCLAEEWIVVEARAADQIGLMQPCFDAAEPKRSIEALQTLQDNSISLRREVDACQARIVLLEGKVASSPRPEGGEELRRMHSTEQQEAMQVLLAQPVAQWSEAQVQQWIGLIGLPAERVQLVQHALAEGDLDGEELDDLKQKRLCKLLQKVGAEDAAGLATLTLNLHVAAQGEVRFEGKLNVAKEQLVEARKALRDNSVRIRKRIVELKTLASSLHFPELLIHEDVKTFMGSDGLLACDRRLADYDDLRPLRLGRSEVTHAKFDGADVCLKKFLLEEDMRGYMKEIVNVQRLQHRNIIHYSAVFEDEGSMFIEMEYCKHGSLTKWAQETHPDDAQRQSVLRQVLLALACIHDQKIVHCDIKGDNVLIAEDGSARICDFEMSKDLGAASASTMVGGTLGFIAPEVRDKRVKPSCASDMFGFGVLALNLLQLPTPADYPLTDPQVIIDPAHRRWVTLLMHEEPAMRPSAFTLERTEAYFDVDRVLEQRAQEAEATATAARQAAEAQMRAARAAEERAKSETEEARTEAAKQMVAALEAREQARVAEARADAEKAAAELVKIALPQEWTSVSDSTGVNFVDVPDKCGFFARKMKRSAKITATTSAAHSMDRLRVHRVVRVENAPLFESYQRERAKICRRLDNTRAAGHAVARLEEHAPGWLAAKPDFPAVIDSDSNELWLWHGTSASIDITHPDGTVHRKETWEVLARHGFDERVGGDSNGGLKASRHHCLYIVEISKSGNGGFTTAADDSSDTCDDVLRLRGLRRPMTELHCIFSMTTIYSQASGSSSVHHLNAAALAAALFSSSSCWP